VKRLALALTLVPTLAAGQDFGIDLSEEKTPPEFRPSIAFVGVTPAEADEQLAGRARLLEAELLKSLADTEDFATVKQPVDVAGISATARKCLEPACLNELADKLQVHRVITATLSRAGPGTVLQISGFDPTLPAVLPASIESGEKQDKAAIGGFAGIAGKSQAQRDKEFITKARPVFVEMVKKLKTPLGKLGVDVIEPQAITRVKGKDLGTGTFEKALPAATYELEVTCEGYLPFTSTVTVEPMKKADVKVTLVAKPIDPSTRPMAQVRETGTPFYKRPGLFMAIGGAALVGLGFMFGAMAKGVENRAVDDDGDGVLDITRAEANGARTNAVLANVFVPLGGAMMVGGLIWFFVTPSVKGTVAPAGPALPSDEQEGAGFGAVNGLTVGMGGTF
jgi:hypothetical protein